MRITSGIARGISLESPKGDNTRPATDAARQAIFSSLGELVIGARVLDLFAGTGSYGLESASRGATEVFFVENDRRAFACLKQNVLAVSKSLRASGESQARLNTISADVQQATKNLVDKNFDIIFADPPYRLLLEEKSLLAILKSFTMLAGDDTLFILEAPADFEFPTQIPECNFTFDIIKRLGKKSKGKPSQIIFKIQKK